MSLYHKYRLFCIFHPFWVHVHHYLFITVLFSSSSFSLHVFTSLTLFIPFSIHTHSAIVCDRIWLYTFVIPLAKLVVCALYICMSLCLGFCFVFCYSYSCRLFSTLENKQQNKFHFFSINLLHLKTSKTHVNLLTVSNTNNFAQNNYIFFWFISFELIWFLFSLWFALNMLRNILKTIG